MRILPKGLAVAAFLFLALIPVLHVSCRKKTDYLVQDTIISHGIIPLPLSVTFGDGELSLGSNIVVSGSENLPGAIRILKTSLANALSAEISFNSDLPGVPVIRFETDPDLNGESYRLIIHGEGVIIYSGSPAGAFYASQTLRQIIWNNSNGREQDSVRLPQMTITDSPKYSWRGFHIDVSRHLFTKEYIEKTIDWLALYKFNRLQIHLTDDQGWRIQIDQYPLLTEKGAWRSFNEYDSICIQKAKSDPKYRIDPRFIKTVNGETKYGGFFTKEDIREIIAYAADNFIEVIPEIDMPGHMSAAISAYPYLSCAGTTGWGREFSYPICPCNEDAMDFCSSVWNEVTALFPGSAVHIGCDEVEKDTWDESSECQEYMKKYSIKGVNGIQDQFLNKMQVSLESHGKKVIAWDDVVDGSITGSLIIMYWRDWVTDSPYRAALNGNDIILTPWNLFYLSSSHTDEALKGLYEYDPSDIFSSKVLSKVIGFQGCVWTEEIPSESMFEYLVYPRLQALSEVAWSSGRSWSSFTIRLEPHLQYMNEMHIGYREPNPGL